MINKYGKQGKYFRYSAAAADIATLTAWTVPITDVQASQYGPFVRCVIRNISNKQIKIGFDTGVVDAVGVTVQNENKTVLIPAGLTVDLGASKIDPFTRMFVYNMDTESIDTNTGATEIIEVVIYNYGGA